MKVRRALPAAPGLALLLIALSLCLAGSPAWSQPAAAAQVERDAVVRGLQAQYEIALIRERKLADDRESALIGALELRLKQARASADAAKGQAQRANVELVAARADYARLASELGGRNASVQADVEAYRAQAQRLTAQASPEKLAALQRFADGDRLGAWPTIERLVAAQDAAPGATDASRAADARQLAGLRDVMRGHGEATTADVLTLFEKAAALDPSNFATQIDIARLAHDGGDLVRARAAAEQAVRVAAGDSERATALRWDGEQRVAQHDIEGATTDFGQALTILRQVAANDPSPRAQSDVAAVLQDQGDLQIASGDFKAARSSLLEGLAIRQHLAEAAPNDAGAQDLVTSMYQRIGDLDEKTGDLDGARQALEQALTIRQRLLAADPSNTDLQYYVSGVLRRLGDLSLKQGDLAAARTAYAKCLEIRRRLSAANPASAQLQEAISLDLEDLAAVAVSQNDVAEARSDLHQSLDIRRRLGAADPTNAAMQQLILRALARLARLAGSGVTWDEVATQYRGIKAAGQLTAGDERVLEALRAHGVANGL